MRRTPAALFLCLALPVLAQAPPPPAGPAAQAFKYDPGTEVKLSGQVREVTTFIGGRQGRHPMGVRLVVAAGGAAPVHVLVGPLRFLESRNVAYLPGDAISFVGSEHSVRGRDVVLAREITRNGQTLVLRDAQGFPAWRQGKGHAAGEAAGEVELPEAF